MNGVLLLSKAHGMTSQTAVTLAKRLYDAAKAGHTGTLDPMAEGLLPVCFGEATKFSQLALDADKGYTARVRLGVRTTTGDLEGEVIETSRVAVERAALEAALKRFSGEIFQTPPMYSAVKHEGRRLYELARKGETVPRQARRVTIRRIALLETAGEEFVIDVTCSKGTYIRVLAEDIGAALGCGASLSALVRTRVGAFVLGDAVTLDALESLDRHARDAHLKPVESLVTGLPRIDLDSNAAGRLASGRPVSPPEGAVAGHLAQVFGPAGRFLGVGEVEASGELVARRLMATAAAGQPQGIA